LGAPDDVVEVAGEVVCGATAAVAGFVRGFARFAGAVTVICGITLGLEAGALSVVGDCVEAFSGTPAMNTKANANRRNAFDTARPCTAMQRHRAESLFQPVTTVSAML
jgi:hypothetical protein